MNGSARAANALLLTTCIIVALTTDGTARIVATAAAIVAVAAGVVHELSRFAGSKRQVK